MPDLEASAGASHIEPTSRFDRAIVVIGLKIMRAGDVIAMIYKFDAVEGHLRDFSA